MGLLPHFLERKLSKKRTPGVHSSITSQSLIETRKLCYEELLAEKPLWKENGSELPPVTRSLFHSLQEELVDIRAAWKTVEPRNCLDLFDRGESINNQLIGSLMAEVKSLTGFGRAKTLALCFYLFSFSSTDYDDPHIRSHIQSMTAFCLGPFLPCGHPNNGDFASTYHSWRRAMSIIDNNPEQLLAYLAPKVAGAPADSSARIKLFTRRDVRTLREWRASWRGATASHS